MDICLQTPRRIQNNKSLKNQKYHIQQADAVTKGDFLMPYSIRFYGNGLTIWVCGTFMVKYEEQV